MRMKEKGEQMDEQELEQKIVSLMQQGFKRAEISKTLGLTSDEVYQESLTTKVINDLGGRQEAIGQLNPTWVEWLMGLPLGWTDLGSWGTE